MKKLLSIIVIIAISLSATAQQNRDALPRKDGMHGGKHKPGKMHNRQMMKEMNFSDAQKAQLKANRESYKAKMQQLNQQQDITVKEFKARKEALNKEQRSSMQSILTAEQKSKMAEMRTKREQENKARENKRFEKMKTNLSLSNEQASQIKAQNETVFNNLKAIRENESLSMEQKKQQMKAIKDAARQERMKVLTTEQQQKMEDLKKENKHKGRK
ncbi:MAG: hypothetical protein KBF74_04160 [Ferruginibacter sp.]|nr:hypothetical protein [Ferruginibacter sp.]